MNLKFALPLFLSLFALSLFGQTTAPISVSDISAGGRVYIKGNIVGAENQKVALLNKSLGGLKSPILEVMTDEKGNFIMDTTIAIRDYYFLRLQNGQLLNIVLSPSDSIIINGDATDLLRKTAMQGSPHSVLLNGFLVQFSKFKEIEDSLKNVLKANPQKQAEVNAYFGPIAQSFYGFRNNFINSNQTSPGIVATLSAINQEKEWKEYKQVVQMLTLSFGDSPTIQNLNRYLIQKEAQVKQQQQAQLAKDALFKPGTPAKEISLPDPTGKIRNLSDLKGKVVLIDFWASWCKPCRQENPNVVRAYSKYNADGFEVFSVSLDKNGAQERWKAAIAQDGLIWPNHVSDLKGFGTKAAQDYMVNSIPFTVLIDAEGNVIATNLRGARLEEELKRIFGH